MIDKIRLIIIFNYKIKEIILKIANSSFKINKIIL